MSIVAFAFAWRRTTDSGISPNSEFGRGRVQSRKCMTSPGAAGKPGRAQSNMPTAMGENGGSYVTYTGRK
eukprot:7230138-Pyramimonas_sp.AAC.1